MSHAVYAHSDDVDHPDETRWLPGELGEPRELHAGPTLHVQLERSLVYPNGVLLTVTVRALVAPTREAQRSFGNEVIAFHRNDGAGPRLEWWQPTTRAWDVAEPWGHGGSGGLYVLPFWIAVEPEAGKREEPLQVRFIWNEHAILEGIEMSPTDLRAARERARQLLA